MYGYLCNGNPSEKTVTEARCYANCLEWVSKEKKMPTIFRRLDYVYFEIEALFIREKKQHVNQCHFCWLMGNYFLTLPNDLSL